MNHDDYITYIYIYILYIIYIYITYIYIIYIYINTYELVWHGYMMIFDDNDDQVGVGVNATLFIAFGGLNLLRMMISLTQKYAMQPN